MKQQILLVDDQVSFCHHIKAILEQEGYRVAIANRPDQALQLLSLQTFDILLTDMKMPDGDGLKLFKLARKTDPDISGIIMTAYGSIASAVDSIKEGITDYLQKPFEPEALLIAIEKTLRERQMLQEIRDLRKEVNQRYAFGRIIGKNHKMRAIYDLIEKVAPMDTRVFITGDTGVGKELVAKAIHFNSNRKKKPFVGINCGALAENLLETELFGHEKGAFTGAVCTKKGKFEYAQGGTLFLDEIGDISTGLQVKLLRVTQEKKIERVGGNHEIDVDVRIISATNQAIEEKIKKGKFRVELYYRLNVVPIHIPPLRERIDDIPLLVNHFINSFNRKFGRNITGVSTQSMRRLMQYDWPGNVRELENVLERAFVITEKDFIETIFFSHDVKASGSQEPAPYPINVEIPFKVARAIVEKRFEKAYLREALNRSGGNVSETARMTGINPRTLWRKMKAYGIEKDPIVTQSET
ncbi:MAG: sigma-54 dependent transcriptional regulator [Pseudomonadota bacterium]